MDGLEHQMAGCVDEGGFLLGIAAPEEEDGVGAVSVDDGDNGIGELLLSVVGVGVGLPLSHGEGGVEQQHPLVCPALQVARGGNRCTQVTLYLFIYILQRWWHFHAVVDREAKAVGLSFFMIGVLAQDDHAHAVERATVKGIKNQTGRWITPTGPILLAHIVGEQLKVGFVKLGLQHTSPAVFYTYVHQSMISIASP
jgi:hypothetical protein